MKLSLSKLSFCTPQALAVGLFLFSAQPVLAFSLTPSDSRLNISIEAYHVQGHEQGYLPLIKTSAIDFDSQTDSLNSLNAQATVSNSAYGWNTVNQASSSAVFHSSDSGRVALNSSYSTTLPYSPVWGPFRDHMGVGIENSFAYWFNIPSGGKLIVDYNVEAFSDYAGLVNDHVFAIGSSNDGGWGVHYNIPVGTGSVEFVRNLDSPSTWNLGIAGSNNGIGMNSGVPDARYFERRGLFNWRFEPFPANNDGSSNGQTPNNGNGGSNPGNGGSNPGGGGTSGGGSNPNSGAPTAVPTPLLLPGLIGMFIKIIRRNKEENIAQKEARV